MTRKSPAPVSAACARARRGEAGVGLFSRKRRNARTESRRERLRELPFYLLCFVVTTEELVRRQYELGLLPILRHFG